jgi:histidine ammonia-lyase
LLFAKLQANLTLTAMIFDQQTAFIDHQILSIEQIRKLTSQHYTLKLSAQALAAINKGSDFLEKKLASSQQPIYGINTGFGAMCNHQISADDTQHLQQNLVRSHACGMGNEVPLGLIKLMILLKIQSLSYGNSGISLETVERLVQFYNHNILPVIYEQGSLGASGDLAPLAHLALPLMGEGEVWYEGKKQATKEVLQKLHWKPLVFRAKEGLALLNGTQFMAAYGVWILLETEKLSRWADVIAALSLEAFDGRTEPFDDLLHQIRPHEGQLETAKNIRNLLKGSQIAAQEKKQVQDPYSFRCVPQVHGASKDAIKYAKKVFEIEINSVTDNPNLFPDEDKILSGGNFHGQPLALSLDFLCLALAEFGNISERRTYQLISGQRGLPPFLAVHSGLHSGLMIPQYTAAAIVSQSKQLCTPASADSIVSSNGQEDHVSMGANAALKTLQVTENTKKVLAIELLTAAQALSFRSPTKTSPVLAKLFEAYRQEVSFMEQDRYLHEDMIKSIAFLENFDILGMVY